MRAVQSYRDSRIAIVDYCIDTALSRDAERPFAAFVPIPIAIKRPGIVDGHRRPNKTGADEERGSNGNSGKARREKEDGPMKGSACIHDVSYRKKKIRTRKYRGYH